MEQSALARLLFLPTLLLGVVVVGCENRYADEPEPWYLDADGDGWLAFLPGADEFDTEIPADHVRESIDRPGERWIERGVAWDQEIADCDDEDADVFPGADELCDGLDNDCSGGADDVLACGGWGGEMTFRVTVVEARAPGADLANDPDLSVRLAVDGDTALTTPVRREDASPVWNSSATIQITADSSVEVYLLDEDEGLFGETYLELLSEWSLSGSELQVFLQAPGAHALEDGTRWVSFLTEAL